MNYLLRAAWWVALRRLQLRLQASNHRRLGGGRNDYYPIDGEGVLVIVRT